jgi:hypothetical protein
MIKFIDEDNNEVIAFEDLEDFKERINGFIDNLKDVGKDDSYEISLRQIPSNTTQHNRIFCRNLSNL